MTAIFQVSPPGKPRFEFIVTYERPIIIGRGSSATVRIEDPGLSRRHCQITLVPQGLMIQDLGSSNGTYVNGQKITSRYLRPGEEISIGQTVMRPYPANTGRPSPPSSHLQIPNLNNGSGEHPGYANLMPSAGRPPYPSDAAHRPIPPPPPPPPMPAPNPTPRPFPVPGSAYPMPPGSGAMPRPNIVTQENLDPNMIRCSRCGTHFRGTRAQIHWRKRSGDPNLLICEPCKDRERMANDQIRGYDLLDVLGKGAMGIVYKARRTTDNEIVALKVVNLEGDPNGLKNFVREAETGAAVIHRHSVRTLEMGDSNRKFYITMEYVEGQTLEDLIKERGPIDQGYALNLAYALLDVLEAARKVNVVHRDLKPANILITKTGEPKVTDFGLAKLMSEAGKSGLTAPGDLRGTPMFMPPEQIDDARHVDHRADLYSFGATLYNALTNRYPFNVKTLRDLCVALEQTEPQPVCELNPMVSPQLSAFVQKLMSKKPKNRFQTASEAQAELRRIREQILPGS